MGGLPGEDTTAGEVSPWGRAVAWSGFFPAGAERQTGNDHEYQFVQRRTARHLAGLLPGGPVIFPGTPALATANRNHSPAMFFLDLRILHGPVVIVGLRLGFGGELQLFKRPRTAVEADPVLHLNLIG